MEHINLSTLALLGIAGVTMFVAATAPTGSFEVPFLGKWRFFKTAVIRNPTKESMSDPGRITRVEETPGRFGLMKYKVFHDDGTWSYSYQDPRILYQNYKAQH